MGGGGGGGGGGGVVVHTLSVRNQAMQAATFLKSDSSTDVFQEATFPENLKLKFVLMEQKCR